nr:hypothetical protein RAR13_00095 [Aminobacter aminovorans]
MDAFSAFVKENWPAIAQAPGTFLAVAFMCLSAGFALGRFFFNGRISTLDAEKQFLQSRIAAYESKLGGASPDEAFAKVAELERRVEELTDPRLLKPDQLSRMSRVLAGMPGKIFIARDMSSAESAKIYKQVAKLFRDNGWEVTTQEVLGIEDRPDCGLTVITRTGDKHTEHETALTASLRAAGIVCELRREPESDFPKLQLHFSDQN